MQAFRADAFGMLGLGDLPGGAFSSVALATSADGSVVVGSSAGAGGGEAFVWDPANGMRSLAALLEERGVDLTGWTLSEATGMSADGRVVVGTGTNPAGQMEAWLAMLGDGVMDEDGDGVLDGEDNCPIVPDPRPGRPRRRRQGRRLRRRRRRRQA